MKTLDSILDQIPHTLSGGDYDQVVSGISIDSRLIKPDDLFIAIAGNAADGHEYIDAAIENGATAILCNKGRDIVLSVPATLIKVEDTRKAAGLLAANFYDWPSKKLNLVGVTGTNGKTSIVQLAHRVFNALGEKSGMLSTVENKIGDEKHPSSLTTPDPISLQKILASMVEQHCSHAFMEVSSHAIVQYRISGCHFKVGVFTNITHDHLDYHGTFDAYITAKKQFFDGLPATAHALINLDDRHGKVMIQNSQAKVSSYALKKAADFKGKIQDNSAQGMQLIIDGVELYSQLVGAFNASNLLATYAIGRILGQDKLDVLQKISALPSPPGRMEVVRDPKKQVTAFVDYAHTPDALKNVLETIWEIKRPGQEVITVVGCGGDRDVAKRPVMTRIAARFSDKVILTSDNPRSESPEAIIKDMEAGIPRDKAHRIMSIVNRREAIKVATNLIGERGILLIAGKGHETYQEINGERHPFDDRTILRECFGT